MYETKIKIINATMELIMERGYSSTTTKDIAKKAGVNESTIFRNFNGKIDIVLNAMERKEWNPDLALEDFLHYSGNLKEDLYYFSKLYLKKITPRLVKVSIGLRCPELFDYTKNGILQIPTTFKKGLKTYFKDMYEKKLINSMDYENMAMMFLCVNFGFVFLKASFDDNITFLRDEEYIKKSIDVFVEGIKK